MSNRVQKLREERAKAWSKMQEIDDRATREERALTVEERQSWDALEAEIAGFTDDIGRAERSAALDGKLGEIRGEEAEREAELRKAGGPKDGATDEARVMKAFENFARRGMSGLAPEDRAIMEARAQSEGTNTAGGYLVPTGYWRRITEVMKAYGGLLGVANVIDTESGQLLPWPGNDDTGNVGEILGENVQIGSQDVAFTTNQLQAWTYSSKLILVSLALLQDSAFNLDAWLPGKIGTRIGRIVAQHLVNGTGTSQPKGIIQTVVTGKTGATGQTTSIIYDDLVDLQHSVDPAYRNAGNVRWVMADSSLAVIRKLKDSQGHPLWQPAVTENAPDLLLGKPITIDQAVPAMAASAKSVLFGDFHAGYVVRRVAGGHLMRLTERYADYLQVGFFGFGRFDGQPDDTHAVRAYVNSAT